MDVSRVTTRTSRPRTAKSYRGTQRRGATAPSEPASLEDILITDKLNSRRRRKANSHYENIALQSLARVMATSPKELVDALLRLALKLCNAGTAGLSLLEIPAEGDQVFRWTNVAGALSKHVERITPRNFSPCGLTLDHNAPQLFAQPARYFQYLGEVNVPIVEVLVIPIYVADQSPGTIWIVSHEEEVHFDSEDSRIMTVLAEFTSCAIRLTHACEIEHQARVTGEKEIAEHKKTEELLRQTQSGLESLVDARTAQLQQLSVRLMASQDDERRRIARELHDSTGKCWLH
jgi:signal transduction histidine kinase